MDDKRVFPLYNQRTRFRMIRIGTVRVAPTETTVAIICPLSLSVVFRGILKTVYDYKVETVIKDIKNPDNSEDSHLFTVFLFDEETGRLFEKQYKEFQNKFFEEHGGDIDSLSKIYSNSIIAFMLSARVGDAIPLL